MSIDQATSILHNCCEDVIFAATKADLEQLPVPFQRLRQAIADLVKQRGSLSIDEPQQFSSEASLLFERTAIKLRKCEEIFQTYQQALHHIQQRFDSKSTNLLILAEAFIPFCWDYELDIILLYGEQSIDLAAFLRGIGQNRIIILATDGFECGSFDFCNSTTELEYVISQLPGWSPSRVVLISDGDLPEILSDSVASAERAISFRQVHKATLSRFTRVWCKAQIANIHQFPKTRFASELREWFSERDVVIVSPGPSLSQSIEDLKSIPSYVPIIAVAQACPALEKHQVRYDFIFVADPGDLTQFISDVSFEKIKGLILPESAHPLFFECPSEKLFVILTEKDIFGLCKLTGQPEISLFGSSVSVCAADFAIQMDASSIVLVGQDLAVSSQAYYGAPKDYNATKMLALGEVIWRGVKYINQTLPAIGGGLVTSRPDFRNFHFEFSILAEKYSDRIQFINATVSGALIDGFEHMDLKQIKWREGYIYSEKTWSRSYLDNEDVLREFEAAHVCASNVEKIANQIIRLCDGENVEIEELSRLEDQLKLEIKRARALQLLFLARSEEFSWRLKSATCLDENISNTRLLYVEVAEDCKFLLQAMKDSPIARKDIKKS